MSGKYESVEETTSSSSGISEGAQGPSVATDGLGQVLLQLDKMSQESEEQLARQEHTNNVCFTEVERTVEEVREMLAGFLRLGHGVDGIADQTAAIASTEASVLEVFMAQESARAARREKEERQRIERQNTQEGIRALAAKKYTGNSDDYSLIDFMSSVDTTCRIHEVTKDSQKLKLAVSALAPAVQRQWSAQLLILGKENITPTTEHVFSFLQTQYEPLSTEFEAVSRLKHLMFVEEAPGADLVKHNQTFDELIARIKDPLPPTFLMNMYRTTLPNEYQVASLIQKAATLKDAKEAASFMWNAHSRLQKAKTEAASSGSRAVEYMDVDKVAYNNQLMCTKQEFESRLRNGQCGVCGRDNHIMAQCRYAPGNANKSGNRGKGRNRNRNRQVNAVMTTAAADTAAASVPAPEENNQGNF
ncbi:hypothetical protein GGI15_004479 [Coemansia interrupta]|uniref:Uncharacterized protein n=1 Tax=Coemansia interrupta TaxID=1126814 RepID=A0A9W8LDV3_9FUNG|nr:hypothetical protein GGI15_004479 [Coemansia interrupta]